jgi:hypothetical protein
VTATLSEPLYSYDRIVVPSGTKVFGHVEQLTQRSKKARALGYLRGDLSSPLAATLRFDSIALDDGTSIPVDTRVTFGIPEATHQVAGDAERKKGTVNRARVAATQRITEMRQSVTSPGRLRRLKEFAISQLPYHPQYLRQGTLYNAELVGPLSFGTAVPTERAPSGTVPPANSVLHARLLTELRSGKTPRGTVVRALVTKPLMTSDGHLLIPEGTELTGTVTFERSARHFRRNGQLRFLFETVHIQESQEQSMLASLYSADVSGGDHIVIDDEGGAKVVNSKARFAAPALAVAGAAATFMHDTVDLRDNPGTAPGTAGANVGGRSAGGFAGLGLAGMIVGQTSRRAAIVLGGVGVVESIYSAFLAKGRDVVFPVGTPMQVQLSATPAPLK